MRNVTLVDSGPLIALFDRSDRYHDRVLEFLKGFDGKLLSSWPVLTEVSHMLSFNLRVQLDFLEWISRGAVEVASIEQREITSILAYMRRYLDVPMDLADASLIHLAEREGIETILSIDRDYYIYRTEGRRMLQKLL